MNTVELLDVLEEKGVPKGFYSVGRVKDGRLVLLTEDREWKVFAFERGERFNTRVFSSEDEACRFVLEQLDPSKWKPTSGPVRNGDPKAKNAPSSKL